MTRSVLHRLGFLRRALAPEDMKILDVGANPINVPAYQALIDHDMCHVWGFEPNPKAFAELEKAQSDKATYFPVAIGPEGPVTATSETQEFRPVRRSDKPLGPENGPERNTKAGYARRHIWTRAVLRR